MAGRSKPLTFSEATSSEAFAERFSAGRDARLVELLSAAVTHAHDLIKQFRPTQDEWRSFIAFLTEVGHASDERRQEWVLLSDLIGASALIEDINSRRPKGATPNTIRGPFFRADAPARASASSISLDGIGEPLMVSVRVQDLDGLPVAGARLPPARRDRVPPPFLPRVPESSWSPQVVRQSPALYINRSTPHTNV